MSIATAMSWVPRSSIPLGSDAGDSDASAFGSVSTPFYSSNTDDGDSVNFYEPTTNEGSKRLGSGLSVEADTIVGRVYLPPRVRVAVRRPENDHSQFHSHTSSRREGGHTKHKWSAVKVLPDSTPLPSRAQEPGAAAGTAATSATPQTAKTWVDLVRNRYDFQIYSAQIC